MQLRPKAAQYVLQFVPPVAAPMKQTLLGSYVDVSTVECQVPVVAGHMVSLPGGVIPKHGSTLAAQTPSQ